MARARCLQRVADRPEPRVLTGRGVAMLLGRLVTPQRIVGVRLDDGTRLRAREVVLAAGAMHSPRLLQRYLSSRAACSTCRSHGSQAATSSSTC